LAVLQSPSLRVALGLGDQELEQRLRPALESREDLQIVAQCLAADQLLPLVSSRAVDAIVLAWSLHRLTAAALDQLERPGVIIVLLVPDPTEELWRQRPGPVLSINSEPEAVHQAILAARPGLHYTTRPTPRPEPVPLKPADRREVERGGVIAVTGGAGSPGRTTLAINIATALGAAVPTALVEMDLCAPAMAAYLDLDPSRNVCTLAHAVREDPHAWKTALSDELQPLGSDQSRAVVLCGPPKREMRASVGPVLVERLVDELAQRFRWVILDVGPELLGFETAAASHRAALARADHLLVVSAADFVGLWHTRTALDQIERLLEIERRKVHLVINGYDARFHHSREEVEWHLGVPTLAIVPMDHAALQRAICEQRPVVMDGGSRARRALLALAESLNEGKLRLPEASSARPDSAWWRRLIGRVRKTSAAADLVKVTTARPSTRPGARSRAW
jgi:MinD-like ATPase involved in chromosome partitioning or flagellar assembly